MTPTIKEPPMRRWVQPVAILLAAIAAQPSHAGAAMLGDARVSYSAERTVTVNGRSYVGMVFHVPGRERHEQEIQGIPEVIILDAATKQGLMVLPSLNSYIAFSFPRIMAELDDPALRSSPVGQETVNGVGTTKYRVDHTAADGSHAQGFAWVSGQGVLMRLDGTVTGSGASRGTAIRLELAGLKLGPQNPHLFELPPGLLKLPSGALQGLLGGKSG
jgi:hypothetical protein